MNPNNNLPHEFSYRCEICNLNYKTKSGFWKHNQKNHHENILKTKNDDLEYKCKYCSKIFNLRQNKWTHEKTCKNKNNYDNLIEQVKNLTDKVNEIKEIKSQPPTNIVNNYTTNNTLNDNKKQIIINCSPGFETIAHLTINEQKVIMDKGLDSLMYLIKITNFNKDIPENHSYCVTALNDKHASMIDTETNSIIKTDKYGLFDKVLVNTIKNLEIIGNNPKFSFKQSQKYREKIETLKKLMFQNRKGLKRYYTEINLMSYNNKDVVFETWASLKTLDNIIMSEQTKNDPKMLGFDDLVENDESESSESSDSELSRQVNVRIKKLSNNIENKNPKKLIYIPESESDDNESESEIEEIKIKGKIYLVESDKIYFKNKDGSRGELYGTYINGKVKKIDNIIV
jgi:hypothetical protein